MAALTVGGSDMPVALDSFEVEHEPLMAVFRFADGSVGSEIRGDRVEVRVFSWSTPIMTRSEADAWETSFDATGYHDVAGDLLGETVSCEIQFSRIDGPLSDHSRLQITATEVDP